MIMAWPLKPATNCKASIFFTFRQVNLRLKGMVNHIMIIKKKIVLHVHHSALNQKYLTGTFPCNHFF